MMDQHSFSIEAISNDALTGLLSAALVGFGVASDQDRELATAMAQGIVALRASLPKEFLEAYESDREMKMALGIVSLYAEG